jgi:hypothetical protein
VDASGGVDGRVESRLIVREVVPGWSLDLARSGCMDDLDPQPALGEG